MVQVKSFIGAQPLCTGRIKTCRYEDLFTGVSSIKVLCPPAGFSSDYSRWPNRKWRLIGVFPAASILRSGGPSVSLLCQRTVYSGQFTVQILLLLTRLQRGGMKLTSACRLGAEISPNRCDKNPIPRAAMGRAPRESDLGAVTSDGFLSPPHPLLAVKQAKTRGRPECLPTFLPVRRLCGALKFMSHVGLNAKVYGSVLPSCIGPRG